MEKLNQQFIADFVISEGESVPNYFLSSEFESKIRQINYKLPGAISYSRFVAGIRKRYPHLQITPFAKSRSDDDVACFTRDPNQSHGQVVVIHDWADAGWERPRYYKTLGDWLNGHAPIA